MLSNNIIVSRQPLLITTSVRHRDESFRDVFYDPLNYSNKIINSTNHIERYSITRYKTN